MMATRRVAVGAMEVLAASPSAPRATIACTRNASKAALRDLPTFLATNLSRAMSTTADADASGRLTLAALYGGGGSDGVAVDGSSTSMKESSSPAGKSNKKTKKMKSVTMDSLLAMKQRGEPVAMLTAYDYTTARLANPHCDMLLVGDSLGMVVNGLDSTVGVTLDEVVYHTKTVCRGAPRPFVVGDLPFGSYATVDDALYSSVRLVKEGGCAGVKLEGGGARQVEKVAALAGEGIVTIGHIGLTPQTAPASGGYRVHGKSTEEAARLLESALMLQEAGASMIVLELVPANLATAITQQLHIPTIGIGCGNGTSGQVLVTHDLLGMFPSPPKFVRRYADVGSAMETAFEQYVADVKCRDFPGEVETPATGVQVSSPPASHPKLELGTGGGATGRRAGPTAAHHMNGDSRRGMCTSTHDGRVAVVGGGPVGSLFAAALGRSSSFADTCLITSRAKGGDDRRALTLTADAVTESVRDA